MVEKERLLLLPVRSTLPFETTLQLLQFTYFTSLLTISFSSLVFHFTSLLFHFTSQLLLRVLTTLNATDFVFPFRRSISSLVYLNILFVPHCLSLGLILTAFFLPFLLFICMSFFIQCSHVLTFYNV